MQNNILRNSGITRIFLVFNDDNRQKYPVKLRYMDDKSSYFVAGITDNFVKPKNNTNAQLIAYTTDGLYKNDTTIFNTDISANEITFEVSIPKVWEYEQMRKSSRQIVALPVKIKYEDGFEINIFTYDVSAGGISFYSNEEIPDYYKNLPCSAAISISNDIIVSYPYRELIFDAKFIRESQNEINHENKTLYVYKFINVIPELQMHLKTILLHLST